MHNTFFDLINFEMDINYRLREHSNQISNNNVMPEISFGGHYSFRSVLHCNERKLKVKIIRSVCSLNSNVILILTYDPKMVLMVVINQ